MVSRLVFRPCVPFPSTRVNLSRASQAQFPKLARTVIGSPEQKGRTAIVTGSGRGIGKAIALRLAHDGFDLCLNDIPANKSIVDEVVDEVQSTYSRKAIPYLADVSKLDQVEGMVEESTKQLGPLNVMVANAGIAQVKALLDLSEEDLRRMFEVNVFGIYNCYRAAAKKMIVQGMGGKLLGCASIAAFKPFPMLSHYSASKGAVRSLTQGMAIEMAKHKITVNAYAPGIVGTAMWDLVDEKLGEISGAKKGETIKKYTSELIALGRTSVPEDVSSLVSFMCGPDSNYMTGQTVVVDGGIVFT
ncbi:acetoin dehydrogenase-like protein [Lophiotrema nucula]|uniref:Acetoin dehydrogenase-like protein n=1 Tax=Lophiotrema nucula TaxID=690887 RepID=A0A6A5ZQ75_9PLEO|nr:acetoin dehydrogenase-like protein [Lophiotrema nucula]